MLVFVEQRHIDLAIKLNGSMPRGQSCPIALAVAELLPPSATVYVQDTGVINVVWGERSKDKFGHSQGVGVWLDAKYKPATNYKPTTYEAHQFVRIADGNGDVAKPCVLQYDNPCIPLANDTKGWDDSQGV